jgi:hypothetical protein
MDFLFDCTSNPLDFITKISFISNDKGVYDLLDLIIEGQMSYLLENSESNSRFDFESFNSLSNERSSSKFIKSVEKIKILDLYVIDSKKDIKDFEYGNLLEGPESE